MAQIISRGTNKWLVRVFLGRSADGKRKHHNKVVHGTKKQAVRYAQSSETKRDLGTLDISVSPAYDTVADDFNDMRETTFEDPVLEGELLGLYRSLESIRRKLGRATLELQPRKKAATLSDLKALMVLILP